MLSRYFIPTFVNMKLFGVLAFAILCIILPLVKAAPTNDESLKQQIASDYWSSLNSGKKRVSSFSNRARECKYLNELNAMGMSFRIATKQLHVVHESFDFIDLYPEDPFPRLSPQQYAGLHAIRTRGSGLDSLGHGNILRSLDGMGNDWGDFKGNNWRLGYIGGSPKRGGGLDSLGRGNILRRVSYDDEIDNLIHAMSPSAASKARSLDSLGKGNILKRSIRVA